MSGRDRGRLRGGRSYAIKGILVGVLIIVLLIPQTLMIFLVSDREENAENAIPSITNSWGGKQVISPINIGFRFTKKLDSDYYDGDREYAIYITPTELKIKARLDAETRKRGIYQATLYNVDYHVEGFFTPLDRYKELKKEKINPELQLYISDIMGLKEIPKVEINHREILLEQYDNGLRDYSVPARYDYGTTLAGTLDDLPMSDTLWFSYTMSLNGSSSLRFLSSADQTQCELEMVGVIPSFVGAPLPESWHQTGDTVYASWSALALNASKESFDGDISYLDRYNDSEYTTYGIEKMSFGVKMMVTGANYQRVNRAVKYAILIIIFTFLTFFFTDAFSGNKVPLLGYLLSGIAIILFYILLLSISEYIGFGWAYLISTIAIASMITLYFYGFVHSVRATTFMASILLMLYGLLYILLQMETFPLLVGSIFLFVVLSLVMYFSQRIDWQNPSSNDALE